MSENPSAYPQNNHDVPQPPYQHYQQYHQPPARSSGCGKVAVFCLLILFFLGVAGVGMLVSTILLFSVASSALSEILVETEEKTVTEKFISGNRSADNTVAILTIDGVITNEADGFVAKQIRKVLSDTDVQAVVLRVESPGGTMSGCDYYLHLLKQMKTKRNIPVVVSMGSMATSGGYYVAMAGEEIYAEPSTITGSIGVIAPLLDATELSQRIGIAYNPIVSGPHKAMGSMMKPMSEEERAIWQNLVNDNFDRFKQVIREGRKDFAEDPEALDKLATGQIYTANEAIANKLVDKIGYLEDAVEQAGKLAFLNEHDYKVIQYKPKLSALDALFEARSPNTLLSKQTLSEISTPKVYLLCPYVIPVDSRE